MSTISKSNIRPLFESIRGACERSTWSKAIEQSRRLKLQKLTETAQEWKFQVNSIEDAFSYYLEFFPIDFDWTCDCGSNDDPCLHITSSIIYLKRCLDEGISFESEDLKAKLGQVSYEFFSVDDMLCLDRKVLFADGATRPFVESASALASGRQVARDIGVSKTDVEVELCLRLGPRNDLISQCLPALFLALDGARNCFFNGKEVLISQKKIIPKILVKKLSNQYQLKIVNPVIECQLFSNGAVHNVTTNTLMLYELVHWSDLEKSWFSSERRFSLKERVELFSEILPNLEKKVDVSYPDKDSAGSDIPFLSGRKIKPYIFIECEPVSGENLSVQASLVYGNPPMARVKNGRLETLEEEIPVRDFFRESLLKDHFEKIYGFAIEQNMDFDLYDVNRFFARARNDLKVLIDEKSNHDFSIKGVLKQEIFWEQQGGLETPSLKFTFVKNNSASFRVDSIDAREVLTAWRNGQKWFQLASGGFAEIPLEWLNQYGEFIEGMVTRDSVFNALASGVKKILVDEMKSEINETSHMWCSTLEGLRKKISAYCLDETGLNGFEHVAFRPYQITGVKWLRCLKQNGFGAILADDMGLGKSLQALCVIAGRTLIVVPTSLIDNWRQEIKKFRPEFKVALFYGANRSVDSSADVTITSYGILRSEDASLMGEAWDCVILDEAQQIKNPESQTALIAKKLNSRFKLCLSGTPIENRLEDLWSQMDFVNPGLMGFRTGFKRTSHSLDELALKKIKNRVSPFIIRRLKKDVAADLPEKHEHNILINFSSDERNLYDAYWLAARQKAMEKAAEGGTAFQILEILLRVRQLCCSSQLVPDSPKLHSSKIETIMEKFEEGVLQGHKFLVFSQWTSFLDLLSEEIKRRALDKDARIFRLDGSTKDRGDVVKLFQNEKGASVFLASLKAGGVGLNLTAADHVFITDPWWNPAAENQAVDRAHRIGRENPVFVHRFVVKDSIEERILELQAQKRDLVLQVLEGNSPLLEKNDLTILLN